MQISPLMREVRYACRNDECGHIFVAYTEVSYTTSPSSLPDPSINLPLSKHIKRSELIGQLTHAEQAQPRTCEPQVHAGQTTAAKVDALLSSEQVSQRVQHLDQAYRIAKSLGTFPAPTNPDERPLLWRETDIQHWVNQQPLPQTKQP